MSARDRIGMNFRGAAFLSAALVMLFAVGWLLVARVQAQSPLQIEGQLSNGTRDAPADSVANQSVTLFQITQTGPVTRTAQTDAQGKFLFSDVITNANAYFTRVDYAGVRYFSEIRAADSAASPISLTVYETQTLPADFTLDRVHLILDVQPKRLNGLQLLQVTNPTDRAFFLLLPLPRGVSGVNFDDFREQTRLVRQDDGTLLYPILPTTNEVLYTLALPFTPPDARLEIPLAYNVSGVNLLVSKTGDVGVVGNGLVPGQTFTSQSGQQYLVFAAPPQRAGTTFAAMLSNLPGVDNTQTLQTMILVGGGLGALALLAIPVYRRRSAKNKTEGANERVAQLQAIARLDDAFDAGELDAEDYYAEREALKAELLRAQLEQNRQ